MHPLVNKLRKAFRLGRMDFNEVADKGRRGEVQFIEVEGAVAVTALLSSGEFRTLHVAAVAGDLSRIPDLEAKVEAWARANGCGAIEMDGRPGWSRVDRPSGYKVVAIKYRKTLED